MAQIFDLTTLERKFGESDSDRGNISQTFRLALDLVKFAPEDEIAHEEPVNQISSKVIKSWNFAHGPKVNSGRVCRPGREPDPNLSLGRAPDLGRESFELRHD